MRNLFRGYYKPTEEEFAQLWQECIFSFDTSMLLNIYRYSPQARERLFEILNKLIESLEKEHKEIKTNLKEAQKKYSDLVNHDSFLEEISNLFDGKVGEPYSKEDLDKLYKEAENRFKNNEPPGYRDTRGNKKKEPPDCYGDVVVWFQLIDYMKTEQKPLIFVTDEEGEDWWQKHQGKILSPRPELIQEMFAKVGVSFYLYTGDKFLEYAEQFLKLSDEPEVAEETKEVGIQVRIQDNIKISKILKEIQESFPKSEIFASNSLQILKSAIDQIQRPIPLDKAFRQIQQSISLENYEAMGKIRESHLATLDKSFLKQDKTGHHTR